ncbi:MAG: hypothetical protein ACK478_05630, partial [Flavobacteriales bacterium]
KIPEATKIFLSIRSLKSFSRLLFIEATPLLSPSDAPSPSGLRPEVWKVKPSGLRRKKRHCY